MTEKEGGTEQKEAGGSLQGTDRFLIIYARNAHISYAHSVDINLWYTESAKYDLLTKLSAPLTVTCPHCDMHAAALCSFFSSVSPVSDWNA